jgi:hypothetical protein
LATPHLNIRPGNPDFLDLDWSQSVDEWKSDRVVEMPEGIHRHPLVFVAYEQGIYAIKELPVRLARHEFEILRALEDSPTRTAEAVGLVERRWTDPHDEWSGAVITRYVPFAFPYRELVSGEGFGPRRDQLLDAFAGLLVGLHLSGCYWGDCSLSNVLYRYDAGAIEAVMVDGETSRLYPSLSIGQRSEDLSIMEMNVAGEMADVASEHGFDIDQADLALGRDIIERYKGLWDELTAELVIGPEERYLIGERIGRLHDLGFSVDDADLEPEGDGDRVRMRVRVGGRTYNAQRLRELTGIDASENQAKAILADLNYHEARTRTESRTEKAVAMMQWRLSVFEPLVRRIAEIHPGADPVQAYADFLNHRFVLASEQQRDVENEEAFAGWVAAGFPGYTLSA